jgi:hypothetical protein
MGDWSAKRSLRFENLEPRLNMALEVPAFSSLPGAKHTIYLDFNGHTTTNDQWNASFNVSTIQSPAYSSDSDPTSFSPTELATIQLTWARVAEDFAPFNVNVTTVEPNLADLRKTGPGDTRWGIRAVITKDVAFGGGYGGLAFPGSFNWSTDTPVFIFNTTTVGIAEAVSHEVGHSLGLDHDGVENQDYYYGHGFNATSWAPIMGVGYNKSVTQWDKGEYFQSNNADSMANFGRGPDDLAVITTYNGFGFRPDTVGDTIAVATPLTISGGSITANGIIENRDDVDVYSFITGTGPVSININTAIGANLDVRADLYNSAGNWVATANDLASLNISLNVTLPEGVYYLKVDGVGVGNPLILPPSGYTDYGSIGQYSITGSITPPIGSSVSVNTKSSTKSEGNIGSTSFTFTVTRSGNLSQSATVNYSVAGSGSTPADSTDFVGGQFPSGSVTFAPNISMLPVTILVRGDTTIETEERFSVTLGNPSSGMTIAAAAAIGIIKNDDPISVAKKPDKQCVNI